MTQEDFFAFGCKYLGTYCPELSKPPGAVCFRNSRGSVSSIDTTTGEITIGNTLIFTHEFSDELEIRKSNGGGEERTIAEQYITEIEAYRWDEEPEWTNDEPIRIISDSQLPEIELTKFTKEDGPLTKKIFLFADGTLQKDGSACVMARGWAERVKVTSAGAFGRLIKDLASSQAIALGALRPDLPDRVEVTTKRMLDGRGMPGHGGLSSLAPAPTSSIAARRLCCWTMTARACRPLLRPCLNSRAVFGTPC